MRLDGKVALVTGGTAGIGAGIVEMFTREGVSVAFTGRSESRRHRASGHCARGPPARSSKGAINSLTRQLAVDYGMDNIRANAIIVGFINSGGETMQKLLANEEYMRVIRGMLVLPQIGEPADIAAAAVYLGSDESKYVTGTLLTVDGGATNHQPVLPVVVPNE
ncbi:SDR family NAD(P)-dependent oxidoreductase [Parafrankia sp. FMc2]|uniref:SDR family NAD(P)-dependent oxidoreductase n=1 Tax=Parafrankia sp. FMc2 TaxID=3233196 RepID=UPI0034D521DD